MSKEFNEQERHRQKMEKRKIIQNQKVESKQLEKGLLMVHTGTGKGKSTAAFGVALRMLGYGRSIGIVQFIKGSWDTGERKALEVFKDQVQWYSMGEGFTWQTQDREKDILAAQKTWEKALELIAQPDLSLVILDELNIALRYNYLDVARVVDGLQKKRSGLHIIVTGRNAKPDLIEVADLVVDMKDVKHHFSAGVKAQEGIEF